MSERWVKLMEVAAQVLAEPLPQVPSPCVSVCVMHPQTGLCEGCLRNLQEIGDWSRMLAEDKRQVWQRIQDRLLRSPSAQALG